MEASLYEVDGMYPTEIGTHPHTATTENTFPRVPYDEGMPPVRQALADLPFIPILLSFGGRSEIAEKTRESRLTTTFQAAARLGPGLFSGKCALVGAKVQYPLLGGAYLGLNGRERLNLP